MEGRQLRKSRHHKKNTMTTKRNILALGDSHLRVCKHPVLKLMLPHARIRTTLVPGASAIGILNLKSQTNARQIFLNAVAARKHDFILTNLGEVDACIAIWKVAVQSNESRDAIFERAIANYTSFLSELKQSATVIVISATLPTLKHYHNHKNMVHNVRASMEIDWRDRAQMTKDFNARIADWCHAQGILHLDSARAAVGNNGFVRRSWRGLLDRDHHYARLPYAFWLAQQLKEIFQKKV
jgi:hypothetical protein